ncbi:glutathione ABC transporter substrate-binding protein [Shouchella lehensis]|uniref:Oligopeptide ABC transporter substrate-binding protein n=1 Tax=Shouchella lehensis G1 TaxID=1246626 RepID=A0A060M3G6_9BACI|nr:glutathione ABC transporter substrate-binding protein [Shouchella lehensis]AIC96565.1 oligopeptide ABC transporter substrate-binding protein [Shouchella lehensis G1]
MKRNKAPFYAVLALTTTLGLAACADDGQGDGGSSNGDNGGDATGEAVEGGDLVLSDQSDIVGLDPHQVNDVPSGHVQDQVYEGLLTFDENMDLQNVLAEDHSWNDEGTVLTFQLREGVTFHDGAEFNADAVKANIERITDEEIGSQRAFLFDGIEEINVLGDYEIEFVLEEPDVAFLFSFAHSGGFMISPDVIEADYEAMEGGEQPFTAVNANPAGTGYFKYQSGTIGSSDLVFERNDDHWSGEPAILDTVTFKTIPDASARLAELTTGDSHFIVTDVAGLPQLEGIGDANLNVTDSISGTYFGFNTEVEPFDDVRVRQAIAMAVDKDVVIDSLLDGYGFPANSPVAPGVVGHDDNAEALPFDIEAAKELLAEAGYEDGFSTSIMTNDSPVRIQLAEYMQSALAEINIELEVQQVEWATYLDDTANGKHEMFILGWSSATGDADYALAPLYHTDNHGSAGNRAFYSNSELDAILDEAVKELDESARMDFYAEAQEIANEEVPLVFTHYTQYLHGIRDEVQGIVVTPTDNWKLEKAHFVE